LIQLKFKKYIFFKIQLLPFKRFQKDPLNLVEKSHPKYVFENSNM